MKKQVTLLFILTGMILCCGCHKPNSNPYSDAAMWCSLPTDCKESADVFYIVSTNIMESFNPDGSRSWMAVLNDEEKAILASEINMVHKELFPEKVNFFAPYYHQVTMISLASEEVSYEDLLAFTDQARQEVIKAFDYYMEHYNNGRPFVIAGYSQGATMVKYLLEHMTAEQKERMVAAYMMGIGLSAATLQHPNVVAATGPYDTGVTISFNSVANLDAIYPLLLNNAVECINPVNWRTDDTPAQFEYDGETCTVHVDQSKKVLVVEGFHPENHEAQTWSVNPWSDECYHNYEIYFYNPYIRQNVLDRINHMKK